MVVYIKKITLLLIIIFLIIFLRIFYLNIYKHKKYQNLLKDKTDIYVYGLSAPRGKILDKNGMVLVDNKKTRVIIYHKNKNISKESEKYIAAVLSKYLSGDTYVKDEAKIMYFLSSVNIFDYVDKNTYQKYMKNIISYSDVEKKAKEYITNNKLYETSENDVLKAEIYYLMNKDYLYDNKIIFKDLSEKDYFEILSLNLPGISGEYLYERTYPYGDLMKSIFGSIGKIDKEDKNMYLQKGYVLSDIVGKSFLEKEYEDYLKGSKAMYILNSDGTLKLYKNEKSGNDLTLNIDINILLKLDEILRRNMSKTIGKKNAQYFKELYALVGTPDGKIISALGYRFDEKNNIVDVTNNIISSSFVLGSVVKGASNSTSYHENVITYNKKILDSCVKLYQNEKKCSYMQLGYVDDISALEKSSNYYQFINALKIMGYPNYSYNMKVSSNVEESFNKYRDMFYKYGLGSKTNIDLPNEQIGIKGSKYAPDLLLNFSIGQYDAYTPVQALSYINTIANNGIRNDLSFSSLKNNMVLNHIDIKEEEIKRIQQGFNNVITKGTASGYIYKKDGAGKTGTSETLYDKDNDGIYETKTISTAFVGYMPFINPKYTFVLITPHISSDITPGAYRVPINRYIMSELTEFLFEN